MFLIDRMDFNMLSKVAFQFGFEIERQARLDVRRPRVLLATTDLKPDCSHGFPYYTRTDFMPFVTFKIRPNYFNVL